VPEKSNPFKGIPSLFSRTTKKQDEVMPSTADADDRRTAVGGVQLSLDGQQLIAESKFFDASWYLVQNPDVAAAQVAPLEHYFTCGEEEGRNPGPDFDVAWYKKKYPEFAATGIGALEHYLRFGSQENKSINPVDYRARLENDPHLAEECRDLKSAPLKIYSSPPLARRVNLVVDSMSLKQSADRSCSTLSNTSNSTSSNTSSNKAASLEGTVERGLQVAVLLALATDSSLRVVTRVTRAQVSGFKSFLLERNLQMPSHVEFIYCDYVTAKASLPTSRWDVFVTVDEKCLCPCIDECIPNG
jgi:hypothetical protein